nr:phosphatase PAP2 family protein [candidate division Zixibacteria bacterium]
MLDFIAWLGQMDTALFHFINTTLSNPVTDIIMPFVTLDLHLKIFYAFCLAVILWKGDKRLRLAVIFSLIVLAISDQLSSAVLKPLLERVRPCHTMEVHLLVGCGSGFSMPSSHAANLFGQAYLFRAITPESSKLLIPLAILVALSRVFVGVHYPGDLLVGAALGTLAGFGTGWLFIAIFDRRKGIPVLNGGDKVDSQN